LDDDEIAGISIRGTRHAATSGIRDKVDGLIRTDGVGEATVHRFADDAAKEGHQLSPNRHAFLGHPLIEIVEVRVAAQERTA